MLAHVDMDAFYASVEALDRPELAGRPIIVGMGKRGVVSAASYEARAKGVRSAMPVFQARRLCPEGVFLPVRKERYGQMSKKVMQILKEFTPLVEQVSVDEAFLDLTGTSGLWGSAHETGAAIKARMRAQTGLVCSVGMAPVRFLAKIASDRDKPDGLTVVQDLEAFLKTVSLKEVPGVGKKAQAKLGQLGLRRLYDVRTLGQKRLEGLLGVYGRRLWELSQGIDPTPVSVEREVKSISHEVTLSEDSKDPDLLQRLLLGMSSKVARRARSGGVLGRTVTLKLKHSDHRQITRSHSLGEATDLAEEIYEAACKLLTSYSSEGPFRLIGVGLSNLKTPEQVQGWLLSDKGREKLKAVAKAEDELHKRFGSGVLKRAGEMAPLDRKQKVKHNEAE
ncbi:DNA polymerase IV [Dethiosulfatarculus sandiegensis]|uniref:DNA polymerase IV n=1 Tax=Dethiosulfatarculus sandiegensis TaxID=1429043 RepID=A0A0D2HMR2_9BACT|nr:DNA polymerase IV [Dethiosulfatarculus sandiegensis]KIX11878.1 DNA polymerase IV [Dethiosulfatarculus sandiegensis]